jgi:uncharacterized protein YegJ (DUF2314 family)
MTLMISPAKSLFWGGLAAGVLLLNELGFLDEFLGFGPSGQANAAVIEVDPRVLDAEAAARDSLEQFLAKAALSPDDWQSASVLVEFVNGTDMSRVWVEQFTQVNGDLYRGVLSADAETIPTLARGQVVTFRRTQIFDWAFQKEGQGYGYFSMRAELAEMTAKRAGLVREFLSEHAVPKGW